MTTVHCPSCYDLVTVPPHAREGRCDPCRPAPRRRHRPRRPIDTDHCGPQYPCQ
jgi:hypothetical protein